MEKEIVVKVQVPLLSNEESPSALVYDKSRKNTVFCDVSPELLEIMGGQPEKYFMAQVRRDSIHILFDKEVANPGW